MSPLTVLKPDIPSTVIRVVGQSIPRIQPTAAETVAIPIIHDWGPLGADAPGVSGLLGGPQLLTSFQEFTAIFGDSDTPGRTAVAGAFAGQGLQDQGGAGGVLVYRMGAAGTVAAATHVFQNTAPAPAITLTAKYKGVRGNNLSVQIGVDPAVAANDLVQIKLSGAVVEKYSYAHTDIASLAAAINLQSNFVVASAVTTGVALAATAGTSLTGGNDGSTLTSVEWLAALAALEFGDFSLLAPFDLTDPTIQASLLSWIQAQDRNNRAVMAVIGGAVGETLTTAITRSATMNDQHVVNFGCGTYHDDLLGKDLSTSQLAPRIAGILAARGQKRSLDRARIGGLHIVAGPSSDQLKSAIAGGVVVLNQTTADDADVAVVQGVTTWTSTTDASRPVAVFGDPRLVRVLDLFVRDLKKWGDEIVIGNVTVTDDTRAEVRKEGRKRVKALQDDGLILPGDPTATPPIPAPFFNADDPQDPTLLDTIPFDFGWQFARTGRYIIGSGRVQ